MNKKNLENNAKLLTLLRNKQKKLGISYATTTSSVYKLFAVLSYIFGIINTLLNLVYILSYTAYLNVISQSNGSLNEYQTSQLASIKSSVYTILIVGFCLLLSLLFLKLKKPVFQLCFTVIPDIILLFTYFNQMSDTISAGNTSSYIIRHLLPLGLFLIFSTICSIINIRQNYLDKKGCLDISERIYKRYSDTADNITEEQWSAILSEYEEQSKIK